MASLQEIDNCLVAKKLDLDRLFEITISDIDVVVLEETDFRRIKPKKWVVGFAAGPSTVTVVAQEQSGRTRDEWLKVIMHEMVHLYYLKRFNTAEPRWLFEGLACYLAGQKKKSRPVSLIELTGKLDDNEVYEIGYNAVKRILEENHAD